ncbi:FecR family protein [Mucilaginibacter sp. UR6-11]|uniref:FecR family protein n=1 Tax=Mucilaginibacter sp. UR6-11 TaxID=1435644 RepID=UPI001E3E502D|nr:FecR family protein [Mucilaginibacter sp. UR6-11]MCC8424276.1 FecR domain-containing protein [Mucilaginibacter sp. UR6-11]
MDERYYKQLVKRYLEGSASNDELEVFAHLLKDGKLDNYLIQTLNSEGGINDVNTIAPSSLTKKVQGVPFWLKYAAAVFLCTTIAVYGYYYSLKDKQEVAVAPVKNDALPGGNKAVLTLANGRKVILSSQANGAISKQGSTRVNKVQDGLLVYQPSRENTVAQPVTYNTISTPKGGQYQVRLPDGSNVWLNSISTITFPTVFNGSERDVTITGEVYFEVAKNQDQPFIVHAAGQTVKVLGTHFNINAYPDENAVKTTLLEGGIKISTPYGEKIIIPGQQALVSSRHITIVDDSDTEAAVAWKNGNFVFNNTSLPALMRQLARWYDVNIIYSGTVADHEFVGQIKRSVKLSVVLKILAASGLHFTVNGKNVYIQP